MRKNEYDYHILPSSHYPNEINIESLDESILLYEILSNVHVESSLTRKTISDLIQGSIRSSDVIRLLIDQDNDRTLDIVGIIYQITSMTICKVF